MLASEHPRDAIDGPGLQRHEADHGGDDHGPGLADKGEIERHADAEEEEAEQQAAEGLDVGFQLVAEARFGEEHAGEEGAHRHRQPAELHDEGRAEHDEQRRRGHHLARPRLGEKAEDRIEQVAPRHDDAKHGPDRDDRLEPVRCACALVARGGEEGDDGERRDDGEVLEEEDREDLLAVGIGGLAAFLEDLHDDRRRGEGEAHRRDDGDRRRQAGEHGRAGQQRRADQDLGEAETEDVVLERPQARRLQFETDDEQEHHDAEFGDAEDRFRVVEDPQPERADGDAGDQVADHRAEADPLEDRDRDDACAEQGDRRQKIESVRLDGHPTRPCCSAIK